MAQMVDFCRYPKDLDGCRQSLIEAYRLKKLLEYCMIEGLKQGLKQCRQILGNGLYDETKNQAAFSEAENELRQACEQTVVLGYPLKISAIHELFYTTYYKLVRFIITRKFHIEDNTLPSADDISQDVLGNLHNHFQKGAYETKSLRRFVISSAYHQCIAAINEARRQINLPDDYEAIARTSPSIDIFPPRVIENWEDLDNKLLNSKYGDIINRIILAQRYSEAYVSGVILSAKQLRSNWEGTKSVPDREIADLCEKTAVIARHFAKNEVVTITAKVINLAFAEPRALPLVFAAAAGKDVSQIRKLLEELNNLSDIAIFTRICRICKFVNFRTF